MHVSQIISVMSACGAVDTRFKRFTCDLRVSCSAGSDIRYSYVRRIKARVHELPFLLQRFAFGKLNLQHLRWRYRYNLKGLCAHTPFLPAPGRHILQKYKTKRQKKKKSTKQSHFCRCATEAFTVNLRGEISR